MCVLTTLNQVRNSCFYSWKMVTSAKKRARKALLKRCLHGLHKAVKKRKHLEQMTLSALGFQRQADKNIVRQCFASLRQNKEEEKLTYVSDKLNCDTFPQMQIVKADLIKIDKNGQLASKKRATTAFMTLFGRLLSQYFQKWKNGAVTKGVKLNANLKIRLIKLYRRRLEQAFNLWRVNRSAMIIEMQMN